MNAPSTSLNQTTELEYGQKVRVNKYLKRVYTGTHQNGRALKGWKPYPFMSADRIVDKKPDDGPYEGTWGRHEIEVEGIFLGYRHLTEGYTIHGYYNSLDSEPSEYHVVDRSKVAYISISPHRNPVHVPLDAIEVIE